MDILDEHMGDDAPVGVAADQLQFDFLAGDQALQRRPSFLATGLAKLRRVDIRKTHIHAASGRVDHDAVAILDAHDLLAARRSGRC